MVLLGIASEHFHKFEQEYFIGETKHVCLIINIFIEAIAI